MSTRPRSCFQLAFLACLSSLLFSGCRGASERPARPEARIDHLVDPSPYVARVEEDPARGEIALDNGLVRRTWRLAPNAACVGLDDLMTGQALLRSVRPEARVSLDGREYAVGGLSGQPDHAYLAPAWLDAMQADPGAFRYVGHEVGEPVERVEWKRVRHHAPGVAWPPEGVSLRLDFAPPASSDLALRVSVHYELYDGLPLFCKQVRVHNEGQVPVRVDRFTGEELAVVEHSNWVEAREGVELPRPRSLHVETDMAFGGFNAANANRHSVHWVPDPLFDTQVNYLKRSPCLLRVAPTYGPAQLVQPGESFGGFHVFELVQDSTERERRGLARRRMARLLAPWVTENPLMHHLLASDAATVRAAIESAAEVGFEMIILSFGSGFDLENDDPAFLAEWREVADFAHGLGIELGAYSLLSSRRIGDGNDIVSPEGSSPTHGNCPALTSAWGQAYYAKLYAFFEATGFDVLEHDGPYPGDVDVTPRPPLQAGVEDSRWVQWRIASDFYAWCRSRGVYVNAPDFYHLTGTSKCGMGYREVNWSLPRAQQVIHTRQNVYDGTWTKTPSQGWMFTPLSQYHGGGAAATVEPLDEHRDHYRRMLQSNLGLGVQACYRGPRLFDTERTRDMLRAEVAWFLRYRDILESDLVHGRRADGRDLDWMLHANPGLETRGMLCVYNPLEREVSRSLRVDLHYTGITRTARVAWFDEDERSLELASDGTLVFDVTVPAGSMAWCVIR